MNSDQQLQPLRQRLHSAARRLSRGFDVAVTVEPKETEFPTGSTYRVDLSKRSIHPLPPQSGVVTELLAQRLDKDDWQSVVDALTEYERAVWDLYPESQNMLVLAYGVAHQVPAVLEKTGLLFDMPPESIHAMDRGPLGRGGSYYNADLIANSLCSVGVDLGVGSIKALDFGSSSGRTVRVLQAAFPNNSWYGCDPNAEAIAWASENLPGIGFFTNVQSPPLPFKTAELDLAFAISIWSHFGENAGQDWLKEMHRIIKPGGHLFLTTHGLQSIYNENQNRTMNRDSIMNYEKIEQALGDIYARGFSFFDVFGESGDHGVKHPEWGNAYLSSEWMLKTVCPQWSIVNYLPGGVEGNQDLYLLRRS